MNLMEGSQRVQDTLGESARRRTDENVYHYATQMSLVLRVMTLVTIKATLRVPSADAVRSLTSKMHQRVHTYLVSKCNIEPEKAKQYRERIVRFATVGKDGLFMVESVHVLLGERPTWDDCTCKTREEANAFALPSATSSGGLLASKGKRGGHYRWFGRGAMECRLTSMARLGETGRRG